LYGEDITVLVGVHGRAQILCKNARVLIVKLNIVCYLTMAKYGIHMFSNESFFTRWVGLSHDTFPLKDSQTVYRRLKII
jgi:hypothetical protein